MSKPKLCKVITSVMMLLFPSKVFVWIGKEANEEEKSEAVTSGRGFIISIYF